MLTLAAIVALATVSVTLFGVSVVLYLIGGRS